MDLEVRNYLCLKEIEEPYVFQSYLFASKDFTESRYCVLAENNFIIFQNIKDCTSLLRVPLRVHTKVIGESNELIISIDQFRFQFYHQDELNIQRWVKILQEEIDKYVQISDGECFEEKVHIEKICKDSCTILINIFDSKLLIFETNDNRLSYLPKHAINLRFYMTKDIQLQTNEIVPSHIYSSVLTVRGSRDDVKITFQNSDIAKKWKEIICQSITQYPCCPNEVSRKELQIPNISPSYSAENAKMVFEEVFQVSHSNNEKPLTLTTCVYHNKVIIRVQTSTESSIESGDVCTVYFNYIHFVYWNTSKACLQISFSPSCKFCITKNQKKTKKHVDITDLCIYDNGAESFTKLKSILFRGVLLNETDQPTDETTLFINTEAKINEEIWSKCKCYITKHRLILSYPIQHIFNLSVSEEIKMSDDKSTLSINFSNSDIYIKSNNYNYIQLLTCFNEASKIKILSLNDDRTISKLKDLIKFLTTHGLWSEGIFRKCGQQQKINSLFKNILYANDNVIISIEEFSVYDVASCLKKCVTELVEGIIPENLFYKFKHACHPQMEEKHIYNLRNALRLLPEPNQRILKYICELMFMIVKMGEHNQMNSENLSISTATTIISKGVEHIKDCTSILKCLIDNLFIIFYYSNEEQKLLSSFIQTLKSSPKTKVLRTFYFKTSLRPHIITSNCQRIEEMKLRIEKEEDYLSISVCINDYETVENLYNAVLRDPHHKRILLWHFISLKNKWFKRLIYYNDVVDHSIVYSYNFPSRFAVGENRNLFIFASKETTMESNIVNSIYRCKAKVNKANVEMTLTMPNSLTLSGDLIRDLRLSEIQLYRLHSANPTKLYILLGDDDVFLCEFDCSDDFHLFLFNFDKLRQEKLSFASDF